MEIAVLGTGFIGGTLGRSLAGAGHRVTFGSRHPDNDGVAGETTASVASIAEALAAADPVILALPGPAAPGFAAAFADGLAGKLVIDATNRIGDPVANSRVALHEAVRYARAFNSVGGESMADPAFDG